MKKQDILDAIDNSPLVAERYDLIEGQQVGDRRTYEAKVLIGTPEGGYSDDVVAFYVMREGQNDEQAYYGRNAERQITPPAATFKSEVVAVAEQAKGAGAILAYTIDSTDEDSKVVQATAWVDQNGTPVEQRYLAYQDTNNELQFKQL